MGLGGRLVGNGDGLETKTGWGGRGLKEGDWLEEGNEFGGDGFGKGDGFRGLGVRGGRWVWGEDGLDRDTGWGGRRV